MIYWADQNKKFDALDGLPADCVAWLVQQRRVICTSAEMTAVQARRIIGPDACAGTDLAYPQRPTRYSGHVIVEQADDFAEAKKLLAKRGFGEVVDGKLVLPLIAPLFPICLN